MKMKKRFLVGGVVVTAAALAFSGGLQRQTARRACRNPGGER